MTLRMLKLKLQKLTGLRAAGMQLHVIDAMKDGSERRESMDDDKKEIGFYGVEAGSKLVVDSR